MVRKLSSVERYVLGGTVAGLLLAALAGAVAMVRPDTMLKPAADAAGVRKLPFVVMAVRGRVEYLDKETQEWKQIKQGQVLWEGVQVCVGGNGAMTGFYEGNASITAGPNAAFSFGQARKTGDRASFKIDLKSGQIAARVAEGGASVDIVTQHGAYALTGGTSAAVASGARGDDVAVARGKAVSTLDDGQQREVGERQSSRFSGSGKAFQEGALSDSSGQVAIALHENTVGDLAGDAPSEVLVEYEKRKLQDLAMWGVQQMRSRNFADLSSQLGSNFSVQGIPVSASTFGDVVSSFNMDHQVLENNIGPGDVSVSLDGLPPETSAPASAPATTETAAAPPSSTVAPTAEPATVPTTETAAPTSETVTAPTTETAVPTTETAAPTVETVAPTTEVAVPTTEAAVPTAETVAAPTTTTTAPAAPPPAPAPVTTATVVVTSQILAQEVADSNSITPETTLPPEEPPPSEPPPPDGSVTCNISGKVKYVFKMERQQGRWVIQDLEVVYPR